MKRSWRLQRSAILRTAGSTCRPSTIDAAPAVGVIERRPDDARRATGELRHGVEEMREAGEPVLEGRADFLIRGIGFVAGGHDDSGCGEPRDHAGRRHFRRERHQCPPALERGEEADRAFVEFA